MPPDRPTDRPPETPPALPPEKARQGRRGWQVLLVLVSALVLSTVAWGLVEIYGWTIRPSQQEQVGDPATVEEDATSGVPQRAPANE